MKRTKLRRTSSKRRKKVNVRMAYLKPALCYLYIEYRVENGQIPKPFCVRCGRSRLPGELDIDEPDGHFQGGPLCAEYSPTKTQLVCAIGVYGNACHPIGAHHHDYLAENYPVLKHKMERFESRIMSFLPPAAGEMIPSPESQADAVKKACEEIMSGEAK